MSADAALFSDDEVVLYDVACVCCALNRLDGALAWLGKAIEAGGDEIKLRALDDQDLRSIWSGSEKQ